MGTRQQEKSQQTKNELKNAARQLFIDKGYEDTSISDIAIMAGYSVGSVYRQWKGKQELFSEIWNEYVSDFIRTSIMDAPKNPDKEVMIDYLITRSQVYKEEEMTKKLQKTSLILSPQCNYADYLSWAEQYKQMLYLFLKALAPEQSDHILKSTAGIMHCMLNTDASQGASEHSPKYNFDNGTLRICLLAIVDKICE